MRIAVIVATLGRRDILPRLLGQLARQTRRPDAVLLSAPDMSHLGELPQPGFPVKCITGRCGLAAQRNQALEKAVGAFDVVAFLDDDFIPARDYLEILAAAFDAHPDWVALTGAVIADGVCGKGIAFDAGLAMLDRDSSSSASAIRGQSGAGLWHEVFSTYGCNMAFRCTAIRGLRFDERLPLYGWQEDVDFSSQMRRAGRVVKLDSLRGVHLGTKTGRVSGRRFGYSQVVNPVYLMRKGTVPLRRGAMLMLRNITANAVRSLWPEAHVDRRGRLLGNAIGILNLVRGRIEPERALEL